MENFEKINVLNQLHVTYSEGGDDLCVFVENNEINRTKLLEIGCNEKDIDDNLYEDEIDISVIAFNNGAIYYTGKKFIMTREDIYKELREAVYDYWECVNSNPLSIGKASQDVIDLASQYIDVVDDLKDEK